MDAQQARRLDPWFWSHYDNAAGIVVSLVPPGSLQGGRFVVDFGCGDGATALGFATKAQATVIGIDLFRSFDRLPDLARSNLGTQFLPPNLSFRQNTTGAYSWSVFEHLADVRGVLSELRRILKPDGALFIQIEPLFHSPYGAHLRRLVDEPWAHLLRSEEEYLALAGAAQDKVPLEEQDVLYRNNAFEDVKRHLIGEYRKLNRISAPGLLDELATAGFCVEWKKLLSTQLVPPPALLERFPRELLVTDQVVVLATRH
jgi:ubiquinone/menaquinone biosynthesis C-methylase UbiE